MFILLINYVVMSYRRCKGTAVLGDGEIFAGLLPEVVATEAGICDKALTRWWNRVAKHHIVDDFMAGIFAYLLKNHYLCHI